MWNNFEIIGIEWFWLMNWLVKGGIKFKVIVLIFYLFSFLYSLLIFFFKGCKLVEVEIVFELEIWGFCEVFGWLEIVGCCRLLRLLIFWLRFFLSFLVDEKLMFLIFVYGILFIYVGKIYEYFIWV